MAINRLTKYIREMKPVMAKVVVVSNMMEQKTSLSIKGEILEWKWREDGLLRPGASKAVEIHPIAAEVLVEEEVEEFLGLEGIGYEEVAYINAQGEQLSGIYFHPLIMGEPTYKVILAKEKLKELYIRYKEQRRKLTVDLIGESIAYGALGPFLSLVNL